MSKTLFILVIALTIVTSYADNPCVQLCVDCSATPENETCQRVDQVCGSCVPILDSLQKRSDSLEQARVQDSIAQEQKIALRNEQIRTLATAMREKSTADTSLFKVYIANGMFLSLTSEKGVQEKKKATTPVQGKTDTITFLPPLSEECRNLCGTCENAVDKTNPVCTKVEEQCLCNIHAEEERKAQEKAVADSIAAVEKSLADIEASFESAKNIFNFCDKQPQARACSLEISIKQDNFAIVSIKELEPPPPPKPDTVFINNTTAPMAVQDTSKAKDSTATKDSTKKEKNVYHGLTFEIEGFREKKVAGYETSDSDDNYDLDDSDDNSGGVGLSLGFFKRTYFYRWGSYQIGFNAMYHGASYFLKKETLPSYNNNGNNSFYEEVIGYSLAVASPNGDGVNGASSNYLTLEEKITYHNAMIDIPVQMRLGIPIVFLSVSVHIRKPIYGWVKYEYEKIWKENDYKTQQGFFKITDWEFLINAGIGIEITRHFSLQLQGLPLAIVTYADQQENYTDYVKFSLDIAW